MLGPLATYAEPHCYDLCDTHSGRLTAPLGWEIVRHQGDLASALQRSHEDVATRAEPVREAGGPAGSTGGPVGAAESTTGRRGHLRALPTPL